jgi:hypothetical protein
MSGGQRGIETMLTFIFVRISIVQNVLNRGGRFHVVVTNCTSVNVSNYCSSVLIDNYRVGVFISNAETQ